MKKSLFIPIVIGFVLIPGFVAAQSNTNKRTVNDISTEDQYETIPTVPGLATPQANQLKDDSMDGDDVNDDYNDDSNDNTPVASGSVTVDQAKSIAQNMFPDKTIKKVETENEEGVIVYSVRFTDSSRVDVSSQDGSVVRSESESKQEDESESRDRYDDDRLESRSSDDNY